MPTSAPHDNPAITFITRWSGITASELATAQSFVIDLCALLEVDKPHPTPEQDYMFERPVTFHHRDGSSSPGRIDCYKRSHFCLESKKQKSAAHTKGFDDGLLRAHAQAQNYVRALPSLEGRPPFVLVVDVGTVIEVYAEFSQSGGAYLPFPDPRSYRISLVDLAQPEVRERLRLIWTSPQQLNPALISAKVTREVADLLAKLATSLESNRAITHAQPALLDTEIIASYLIRCLFSMFAEDIGLLPKDAFLTLLTTHRDDPATLQIMLRCLWADMDSGGFCMALAKKVLHFNGKLFKHSAVDGYSLLLKPEQIDLLIAAAKADWRSVEPAIFGTLLERALNPTERHALGAHYTPRAYVERLVLPTVMEPLRAEWANAQAAALVLAHEAAELSGRAMTEKLTEARAEVRKFHHRLCSLRVLDPACGSANFLYVTLEHLKRLEGEVINQLLALGETQDRLGFEGETVTVQQLRGIELNPRAAAVAELVLWIGFLQWHIRTQGNTAVAEPVVHDFENIECRDAVLAWDAQEPAYDDHGQLLTRWDGVTFKTHPVTGALVPEESAQVPQWRYVNARAAQWPQADFIVGNPPFIGNKRIRDALGDGYVQALRKAWPQVPDSADFVMYWWAKAAALVASGQALRFGLITTNSITMIFNRRIVQSALDGQQALMLAFAVPDHPWVDSSNGAAVRIAMTVAARSDASQDDAAEGKVGRLLTVTDEKTGDYGEVDVSLVEQVGVIHADLTTGANVTSAKLLQANTKIANRGVIPHGAGFLLTQEEARSIGLGTVTGLETHIREYRNGKDLTDRPRFVKVIDLYGLTSVQVRDQFPSVYQWLLERVKPERDQNNMARVRNDWWLFAAPRPVMRESLLGLHRYIVTGQVVKHRVFQFLKASILPDDKLIAIALDDAFYLGVLSSSVHVEWALALGGHLGVGNDPVYSKSTCFDTFPFPSDATGLTPNLRQTIAAIAEHIDTHRKQVLLASGASKEVTLTGLYNVIQALKEGRPLVPKEKSIHSQGLVSILKELYDELDAAVLAAYGWSDLNGATHSQELLGRLLSLNAQRAADEEQGIIQWLRPDFQNPLSKQELPTQVQQGLEVDLPVINQSEIDSKIPIPWPATLPEQISTLAQELTQAHTALTLPQIDMRFKGRGKKNLPVLLQTLEALGRAQRQDINGVVTWRA
jgi:hypothetical protein